jgi:hypothetical protein
VAPFDLKATKGDTKKSSIFRVYCGVVSAKEDVKSIRDLIVLAFLREHGWAMDPYTKANKSQRYFVNQKSTQAWGVLSAPSNEDFALLKMTSLDEMKAYLDKNVSDNRLALYGLTRAEIAEPAEPAEPAAEPKQKRVKM